MKSSRSFISAFLLLAPFSFCFGQNLERGKTLYNACIQCHGEKGEGNSERKTPRLSGQYSWYTSKQMIEIKSGVRKDSNSQPFLTPLNEEEIKDLAAYIATL